METVAALPALALLPDPPALITAQRLTLSRARRLANYHVHATQVEAAGPTVLLNSTNVISGYRSLAGTNYAALGAGQPNGSLRWFGNISTIQDCVPAALAIQKLIVSSATQGAQVYLPEGGNPYTSDTLWTGTIPANSKGVLAWAQANGDITSTGAMGGSAYLATLLAASAMAGSWPNGGMIDASGAHHLGGAFGSIDFTNQAEVKLALQFFKCVLLVLNGNPMLQACTPGSVTAGQRNNCVYNQASAPGTNHCFVACDFGTATQLAAQYGITLPGDFVGTTWCLGGLVWGRFVIVDWQSWLANGSYAYVIYTDPDRGDASSFNPVALADYNAMIGASGITPFVLGPFTASAGRVTSGTPTLVGYINGVQQELTGQISQVDALGYAKYIPSAADVATVGQFVIDASLTGAVPLSYQVNLTADTIGNGQAPGTAALENMGFTLPMQGSVRTVYSDNTQFVTNILFASLSAGFLNNMEGQLVTFTSGPLAGSSFIINGGGSASGGYLMISVLNPFSGLTAGTSFIISNLVTGNALNSQVANLPTINEIIVQDGQNGSDGGAFMTLGGQIMGTMQNPPVTQGTVVSAASSTSIKFGQALPVNTRVYVWPQATGLPQWTQVTGLDTGSGSTVSPAVPSVAAGDAWWAPTVPMVALAASQPNYAPATNTPPTMSPEGFTRLWALTPAAQGVALDCIGTINKAGNYTNAANTLPLAWNEGGNGCWGIAIDYEVGNWLGPTTQNSPLGVYTSAGQPNITVVAADPTSQIVRDAMTQATAATPAAGSIDAQLGSLAAAINIAPIVVRRLIDPSGALEINSGCDYPDSSGRSIQFGVPSGFADLTGSTPTLDITLVVGGLPASKPVLTITGQILTGSYTINGKTYTTILDFQPTAAQTASLTNWSPNAYVYRVRAVWTSPAKTLPVVDESPCTALW